MVVFADNIEECHKKVIAYLDRLKAANLHLTMEKCVFLKSQIIYSGYKVSAKGIGQTDKHIQAVKEAPQPKSRIFLRLVAYYNKFIPDAASLTYPLRLLLCKNGNFFWSNACVIVSKHWGRIKQWPSTSTIQPRLSNYSRLRRKSNGYQWYIVTQNKLYQKGSRICISFTSVKRNYLQLDWEVTAIFMKNVYFFYAFSQLKSIFVSFPAREIFTFQNAYLHSFSSKLKVNFMTFTFLEAKQLVYFKKVFRRNCTFGELF